MRRILAIFKIAIRALDRNKMRSSLTALGIIIGVGAVIAMVAIGSGARAQVEAGIAALGQNLIQVQPGFSSVGGVRGGGGSGNSLTREDALAIRHEIPGVAAVSPEFGRGRTISAGNQNWTTQVQGQSEEIFIIREWPIASGSYFTSTDVETAAKVAVIGNTIAEVLFPDEDPIGKVLRVRNAPFVVVGVLGRKGSDISGRDQDDIVIVPITAMRFVQGGTWINRVNVQAVDGESVPIVKEEIIALLRQRHRIEADREDDFTVLTQDEILATRTQATRTMTYLLAGIACVSLVVGGIGIMNIMLVSVTERTREIGTRIAVGAKGNDILLQFLVEAVILSGMGGLLGTVLGAVASVGMLYLLNPTVRQAGTELSISIDAEGLLFKVGNAIVQVESAWVIGAILFSAAVGIFFGFYPARKASRLDPIEALRFE